MKTTALLLSLLLSLPLLACAPTQDADVPEVLSTVDETGAEGGEAPDAVPEEDVHEFAMESNILPHESVGYCGNTITTVRYGGGLEGEEWVKSFWGSPSVELTDLLLYLDYSGDICRCLPEYVVETEFSDTAYGVNLTAGYVRHDGGQVSLTEEQVSLIESIIDQILAENLDLEVK